MTEGHQCPVMEGLVGVPLPHPPTPLVRVFFKNIQCWMHFIPQILQHLKKKYFVMYI